MEGAIAEFGRVDVLINWIGDGGPAGSGDVSPADFSRIIDSDLTGALTVCARSHPQ